MLLFRRVVGHSMLPVLPPGIMVVGLRWFRRLDIDDIVIYELEGKEKIKRIQDIDGEELFVTGDNSFDSLDSRTHGSISRSNVRAKIVWPRDVRD